MFLPAFLSVLFLILLTFCGSFPGWFDSAELALGIETLGISHPPGQPFYTLSAKLFSLLFPLGTAAFRFSAFSVFCGVLTIWVLTKILHQLDKPWKLQTTLLGMMVFLLPSFAMQVTRVELYMLATLLASLTTYFCILAERNLAVALLKRASLTWGLLFCTHTYLSIPLLSTMLVIAFKKRAEITIKELARIFLWGFIPIVLLYGALVLRARQNPFLNWEGIHSWSTFWHFFTGKAFQKSFGFHGLDNLAEFLSYGSWAMTILVFILIAVIFKNCRKIFQEGLLTPALVLFFSLFVLCFVRLFANNPDNHGYILFFLCMCLVVLSVKAPQHVFILGVIGLYAFGFKPSLLSSHGALGAEILSKTVLNTSQPARFVLASDHWYFPTLYRQHLLHEGTTTLIANQDLSALKWYKAQNRPFFDSSLPLYFESQLNLPTFNPTASALLDYCMTQTMDEPFDVQQSLCVFELRRFRSVMIEKIGIDRTLAYLEKWLAHFDIVQRHSQKKCVLNENVALPFKLETYVFLPTQEYMLWDLALLYMQCGWMDEAKEITSGHQVLNLTLLDAHLESLHGNREAARQLLHPTWWQKYLRYSRSQRETLKAASAALNLD